MNMPGARKMSSRPVTKPVARPASTAASRDTPDVLAREQAHDADCAAGAEGAVHGQVRHIKDAVGEVNADGHDAPR